MLICTEVFFKMFIHFKFASFIKVTFVVTVLHTSLSTSWKSLSFHFLLYLLVTNAFQNGFEFVW